MARPGARRRENSLVDHVLLRTSIQARVVVFTLVLSTVVAMLFGWVVLRQVTTGVLDAKQSASLNQAEAGFDSAQSNLDSTDIVDPSDEGRELSALIDVLSPHDQFRDDFRILLLGPFAAGQVSETVRGVRGAPDLDPVRTIPTALLHQVEAAPGTWWQFSRVIYTSPLKSEPSLIVGSRLTINVTGNEYAMFYVFPLTEQQQTLSVLRQALITAAALLVLLLGLIAWLVTRQVVTPVRMARRIAERVAAGRLEERMQVRGRDDIARLSGSFNQMAQTLQRQIRELEELSRVQHRFVADVSHELRTPLTTVRMAADLLHENRDQFDASTRRAAELLQNELDRFESLLTDLLEISRFDAGVAVLELEPVDLRAAARRVADRCRGIAERHGSEIVLRLPDRPCTTEADPRRIDRIVRNLVVNAIEHGMEERVVLTCASKGSVVALTVRDYGAGLTQGQDALVFGRFWRADRARARTRGGTGLGLSIAKEDAELHGGRLDAWGAPGQGSQFRLTLPRFPGAPLDDDPLPLKPGDAGRVRRPTTAVRGGAP